MEDNIYWFLLDLIVVNNTVFVDTNKENELKNNISQIEYSKLLEHVTSILVLLTKTQNSENILMLHASIMKNKVKLYKVMKLNSLEY